MQLLKKTATYGLLVLELLVLGVLDLLHKSSLALVNPSVEVNELVLSQEVYYMG